MVFCTLRWSIIVLLVNPTAATQDGLPACLYERACGWSHQCYILDLGSDSVAIKRVFSLPKKSPLTQWLFLLKKTMARSTVTNPIFGIVTCASPLGKRVHDHPQPLAIRDMQTHGICQCSPYNICSARSSKHSATDNRSSIPVL